MKPGLRGLQLVVESVRRFYRRVGAFDVGRQKGALSELARHGPEPLHSL